MGPRASTLYSYEDPWRVSAFGFVFAQLLLAVLVLVHTVLVCITFQLMKWYGWWIPSRHDSVYGQDGSILSGMCAADKPYDLDSTASKSSPLIHSERFLKRSRSEDGRSAKSKSLVCPKCHGVWTFKQGLSFKNDRRASPQWGETPRYLDGPNSRGSNVEEGLKVRNADDESVNSSNTPIDRRKLSPMCMNENGMCADGVVAEAGSSSKVLIADGQEGASHKSVSEEMTNYKLGSSELACCIAKEMQEEVVEEEPSALTKRKVHEGDDCGSDNSTVKGSKDEDLCTIKAKKVENNGYDSESVINGLQQAIQKERQKLCALYGELEIERIASETAANEAMSMISRLQEEKAALLMQTAHFQRMAEEKANYDEQAMQLLKEILYRKERENYLLEKEVKVMRTRLYKDVRRYGKKRPDAERRSFMKSEETLLLKNIEEFPNLAECHGVQEHGNGGAIGSVERPACSGQIIREDQPSKRLKSVNNDENGTIQSTFLVADSAHFVSGEGYQKAYISQQSVIATSISDDEGSFEFGLRKQVCEKMANILGNGENHAELSVPLESAQSAASAVESELESYYFVATSEENQRLLCQDNEESQLLLLQDVCKAEEVCQSGDRSLKEAGVLANKRMSEFYTTHSLDGATAMMSGCKASTSIMACLPNGHETGDLADHTGKDVQTRLQIFENDMMLRSCPSSLNNKGSSMNKFEENDSSLIRGSVY